MKQKWYVLALLLLLSIFVAASCGGGGGGSSSGGTSGGGSGGGGSTINLSGTVGSGYNTASVAKNTFFARLLSYIENKAYAVPGNDVTTITALPAENGNLNSFSVLNSKSATVNPDKTFSLSLDKNYDWVLLLMDNNLSGTARFVGTVALKSDTTDSLLNLPTSSAATSSIALGTIDNAGSSIGLTANTANTADFSLSAAQLLTLAKTDDIYKNAKNLVLNYDSATGVYYTLRPNFNWRGTYTGLNTTASDPATYTYHHYNFQLDSNSTDVTAMADLCGTPPTTTLKLFPPTGTTATSTSPVVTYNDTTPITNNAAICTVISGGATEASEYSAGGDFFATNAYGNISYTFGGYIGGTIPPGYWQYKVNDVLKGQFDISAVAPLAANSAIKGFSPAIKVNTDVNGKITSVDITWYVVAADGTTKTQVAPSDLSILKHAIGSGDIFFDYSSGTRRYESIHFNPSTQTSVTPTGTWYYNTLPGGAAANELAEGIGVFFQSAGVGFFVDFFKP
jgi:hypothetical protein